MMKRNFENSELIMTINRLRKNKKALWKKIRELLQLSKRRRIHVNISKLSKMAAKHKDIVFVVPGKVLGSGVINHSFSVMALDYSKSALDKIIASSKCKSYRLADEIDEKGCIKLKTRFMILR